MSFQLASPNALLCPKLFAKISRLLTNRRLADEYGVGKTQIQQTIKRKAEYMTAYEDNACSSRKRLCTRLVSDDLEHSVWSWFEKARSMNIPVSGPMLQERALLMAERLGTHRFQSIHQLA